MVNIKLDIKKVVSKKHIISFLKELKKIFFKELFIEEVDTKCNKAKHLFLKYIDDDKEQMSIFFEACKNIKEELYEDLNFFLASDPAIDNAEEVCLIYPGFKAIRYYRVAHQLYKQGYKTHARIITEEAHNKTGIDIHPGASIEAPFFIDHGTGIVIGETSIIGKRCKIYQGVTLGAKTLEKGNELKGVKRHPTIGNDVTIYANASIVGGEVNIGNNVTIGANVYLVGKSIADNTKVLLDEPKIIILERK